MSTATQTAAPAGGDDFAAMLEESFGKSKRFDGRVVTGRVVALENDMAIIDVGLKSEGRIALKEFGAQAGELRPGDKVDVFVERVENAQGDAVLSRERARREEAWIMLEKAFNGG